MQYLLVFLLVLFSSLDQSFQWVSFNSVKRTSSKGKVTRIDAHTCYHSSGQMVTKFLKPIEMYILNNSLGDMQVYNPASNSVMKSLDNSLSSQNMVFFYFLLGNTEDMGLESAGFKLRDSRIEDMMLISEWEPPVALKQTFDFVELVNNGENPVFMGYLSKSGDYVKKIFYYDFKPVGMTDFPMSITEIDFVEGDSVITKSTFSDFRFDSADDKELISFKVPQNAILTK